MTTLMLKPGDSITIESYQSNKLIVPDKTKMYDEFAVKEFAQYLIEQYLKTYHSITSVPRQSETWVNVHFENWRKKD